MTITLPNQLLNPVATPIVLDFKSTKDENGNTIYRNDSLDNPHGIDLTIKKVKGGWWQSRLTAHKHNHTNALYLVYDRAVTKDKLINRLTESVNASASGLNYYFTEKLGKIYTAGFDGFLNTGVAQEMDAVSDHALKDYVADMVNTSTGMYDFKVEADDLVQVAYWERMQARLYAVKVQIGGQDTQRYFLLYKSGKVEIFGDNIMEYAYLQKRVITGYRHAIVEQQRNAIECAYMDELVGCYLEGDGSYNTPSEKFLILESDVLKRIVKAVKVGKNNVPVATPVYFMLSNNWTITDNPAFPLEHFIELNGRRLGGVDGIRQKTVYSPSAKEIYNRIGLQVSLKEVDAEVCDGDF